MNLAADAKRKPDFRNRITGRRALIARWSPFMKFEILEHPADVGFRAWGNSLEEVFANCAQALLSIILDPSEVDGSERWQITAHGSDLDSLLVNWLNEVPYYVDTR